MSERSFYRLVLLAAAAIWGSGYIVTQVAVQANYSPEFILMVRFSLATFILNIIFHRRLHLPKIQIPEWRAAVLTGGSFFAGFLFQTYGLRASTPSMNAFLTATSVIFVPFLLWLIFHRRPFPIVFLASLICFLGILTLSFRIGDQISLAFGLGEGLTLLSAICFALHTVLLGYFAARMDPIRLTFLQNLIASLLALLAFLILDRDLGQFTWRPEIWSLAYITLFNTLLAFLLQTWGQAHVPADQAILIICTESLFAPVFSILLGYDTLHWQLVLGGVLIFTAILLTEVIGSRLAKRELESRATQPESTIS